MMLMLDFISAIGIFLSIVSGIICFMHLLATSLGYITKDSSTKTIDQLTDTSSLQYKIENNQIPAYHCHEDTKELI